jgi:hypothetical protein
MTDLGLSITWYDLRPEDTDAYLKWLHGSYIPKILKKPGVLWAAHYKNDKVPPGKHLRHTTDQTVPTGNDYLLFFGGETAQVFSKGSAHYIKGAPNRLHTELTPEDEKMLAKRVGERICITTEVARRSGPEAAKREGPYLSPPCIQIGTFNELSVAVEEETLAWYADWRLDALGKLPGCVAIRQLVSVVGWAKHGVMYEFTSRADRDAHFPHLKDIYPAESAWSEKCIPNLLHAPQSPIVGQRIYPPIK